MSKYKSLYITTTASIVAGLYIIKEAQPMKIIIRSIYQMLRKILKMLNLK